MQQMILLCSEKITCEQKNDAKERLGIKYFLSLPEDLQKIWDNLPSNEESIVNELEKIKHFLVGYTYKNDTILIHGDYGATYHMVNFVKELGLKTVYSAKCKENNHVLFRTYE